MRSKIPRGIRNNNPLNIRVGNNWIGEVKRPTDPSFEQFTSMKWGVRAAFIVLRNYIERHKCNTIRKIITRWAPSSENDTQAYIQAVVKSTDMSADDKIDANNILVMIRLFSAMCKVENGMIIDCDDIVNGWILSKKRFPS